MKYRRMLAYHIVQELLPQSVFPCLYNKNRRALLSLKAWINLNPPLVLLESPPRVSMTTDSYKAPVSLLGKLANQHYRGSYHTCLPSLLLGGRDMTLAIMDLSFNNKRAAHIR